MDSSAAGPPFASWPIWLTAVVAGPLLAMGMFEAARWVEIAGFASLVILVMSIVEHLVLSFGLARRIADTLMLRNPLQPRRVMVFGWLLILLLVGWSTIAALLYVGSRIIELPAC